MHYSVILTSTQTRLLVYTEDAVTNIIASILYRAQEKIHGVAHPTTKCDGQNKIIHDTIVLVHPKQSSQIIHESSRN